MSIYTKCILSLKLVHLNYYRLQVIGFPSVFTNYCVHYQLLEEKVENHRCSELFKCMSILNLCLATLHNPLYHLAGVLPRCWLTTVEREVRATILDTRTAQIDWYDDEQSVQWKQSKNGIYTFKYMQERFPQRDNK